MTVQERLKRLRQRMKEAGVTVYIVPSSDYHGSEYVCGHFQARAYITGFTGSAGTAVVTLDDAGLWTDGRYFIQAKRELTGTGVALYREGEAGVPELEEYVRAHLHEGELLGFDGRVLMASRAEKFKRLAEEQGAGTLAGEDLVGDIWTERPQIPDSPMYVLEESVTGEDTGHKLSRVREQMDRCGADIHVLSSLCDIAWLLNLRGGDIPCVPVTLSYLCLMRDACRFYVREQAVTEDVRDYLKKYGVEIRDYHKIYEDLQKPEGAQSALLDKRSVNYRLLLSLPSNIRVVDKSNPTELMKAVKNKTELANLREAHIKEGTAFTRFMYWLKTAADKGRVTELSAAARLEELRGEQEGYLGPSFASICAYGPNGAIVHYAATKETDAEIFPQGFFLVDAGGHYREGTTDTTRTFAMGALSGGQKRMFTAVLRGNLNLARARFLYGCSGYNLDVLCREPLWEMGVDYKHGTGHGVGYRLNVHEGPNTFRFKLPKEEKPAALEAGMVTTDEPGVYIEGKYGIRTENELVCVEGERNGYGQFMKFEILTLTPIDLDAVIPEEMTEEERKFLNDYHRRVYEVIAPRLSGEERKWLQYATREI